MKPIYLKYKRWFSYFPREVISKSTEYSVFAEKYFLFYFTLFYSLGSSILMIESDHMLKNALNSLKFEV